MKLIHKTSRYYLGYTLIILAAGTILFYFLIKTVLIDSIDEALYQEEVQIVQNLEYEKDFESLEPSQNIYIKSVHIDHIIPEKYSTIEVYNSETNDETEHYRQLQRVYKKRDKYYEITIRQSLSEAEALLASLLPAVGFLFLIILAGVLIINSYISNKVWKPFYEMLENLKLYDLTKTKFIPYQDSEITEFNELSLSMEKMTSKIYKDFLSQKEFNENSSHEMQTPLAIIRNKLELLIQSQNLSEQDLSLIESVFDAVKRLTLLNKGLLLLSKIENQQFSEIEKVEMEMLVRNSVNNFHMQIEDKELKLNLNILNPCILNFNIILADILLNNLISNAIKHNIKGGEINIELGKSYLKIENTGNPLSVPPEALFERFKKSSESEYSIGLGLAIAKKICDAFKFKISYTNKNHSHSLIVNFKLW